MKNLFLSLILTLTLAFPAIAALPPVLNSLPPLVQTQEQQTVPYPAEIMSQENPFLHIHAQQPMQCPAGEGIITVMSHKFDTEGARLFRSYAIRDPKTEVLVELLIEFDKDTKMFKQAWIDRTNTSVADEYYATQEAMMTALGAGPCDIVKVDKTGLSRGPTQQL